MHAVGRHETLKPHAARVDDLDQFLADLRRVAGRHLAFADHAVKGRPHLRAPQLLPCRHNAGARRHQVALCVVASHLGVFQRLHRRHALGLQGLQPLHLAFGLVEGLRRGPHSFVGRRQAVADGGVVQPHQQVAAAHGLAVFLQHLLHDGADLGAQVGAAFRLHRPRDDGPGGQQAERQRAQVFGRQQQHGNGLGGGCAWRGLVRCGRSGPIRRARLVTSGKQESQKRHKRHKRRRDGQVQRRHEQVGRQTSAGRRVFQQARDYSAARPAGTPLRRKALARRQWRLRVLTGGASALQSPHAGGTRRTSLKRRFCAAAECEGSRSRPAGRSRWRRPQGRCPVHGPGARRAAPAAAQVR